MKNDLRVSIDGRFPSFGSTILGTNRLVVWSINQSSYLMDSNTNRPRSLIAICRRITERAERSRKNRDRSNSCATQSKAEEMGMRSLVLRYFCNSFEGIARLPTHPVEWLAGNASKSHQPGRSPSSRKAQHVSPIKSDSETPAVP